MTKAQFIMKARQMFDGQFPNEIKMDVPDFNWMGVHTNSIKEELWTWFRTSLEKYDELVTDLTTSSDECSRHFHSWIVKADSADKKYYECEWCSAEMQEIK